MIGTYSTIPELGWAVIAQRSLDDARVDAGVQELTAQALQFVVVVTMIALLFGYVFALGITRPIRGLVESTRAMSWRELLKASWSVALRKFANWLKPSITWPATSSSTSNA